MSENEFEKYLALLGGMLRLNRSQRDAIASELRDHLEERLAELLAEGCERNRAIQLALEEFGDAAGLAADFVQVFQKQRRRWMMRMTLGTVTAAAAMVMLAMAFWPDSERGSTTNRVVAQNKKQAEPQVQQVPGGSFAFAQRAEPTIDENNEATERKLAQRIEAEFLEMPLSEVLLLLKDKYDLQIYVNEAKLSDSGQSTDTPITLNLQRVRIDMLLDLVLGQLDLVYIVRDGILIVTNEQDAQNVLEVRIYNCRDLLSMNAPRGAGSSYPGAMPGGGDEGRGPGGGPGIGGAGGLAGFGSGGVGLGGSYAAAGGEGGYEAAGGFGDGMAYTARSKTLTEILQTSVLPESWSATGGPGTVAEYQGLLVINHHPRAHQQIDKVLKMLGEAMSKQPAAIVK